MKGKLHKSKLGWVVRYTECDPKSVVTEWNKSIVLHRNDISNIMMDSNSSIDILEGLEVEFKIVTEYIDTYTNQIQKYATLTKPFPELSETKLTLDENKILDLLHKWRNSYTITNTELSDDELFTAASEWIEQNSTRWSNNNNEVGDNYGSFIAGARWYKENIKNKLNK